jgi:D-aspartate ligase
MEKTKRMHNSSLNGSLSNLSEIDTSTPCVVICPGFHGHGAARSLGRLGVKVYGIHALAGSPTAGSKYWRANSYWDLCSASNQESVKWFLRLGGTCKSRPLLIATDDHSARWIDKNADELSQAFRFPIQPDGLTKALSNKKKLYALCKKHFVLTAETVFPQSREEVEEFVKDCAFPVMVKGIETVALQKRTGLRMVIVNSAAELLKAYDDMEDPERPSLMLQEYIPGEMGNSWMFDGYFNEDSECLFGITARKIRQYPAYTGMTSLGICEENPELREIILDFIKAIKFRGILDIGFKYNPFNGRYYLLDPNPRLGASFRLFVDEGGMDVVRAMYLDLTGQAVKQAPVKEGRKWMVEPFDIASSMRYFRDGKLKWMDWVRSFSGVEEAQWFARDDLAPFLKMMRVSFGSMFASKGDIY